MKEDLADMMKEKLGFVVGKSRLYHRPYVDAFDLILYPMVGVFLILSRLEVMITDPLGSILANILLNLEKSVLANLCVFACFLYL